MEEQQIGWIAAIIIGGIAGWLAEQFMKSQMGLVMNIVLGHHRGRCRQLDVRPAWYHVRRLDRLSDCWLHRSLHPNRDRPCVQRRFAAANLKSRRRRRGALRTHWQRATAQSPRRRLMRGAFPKSKGAQRS